MPSKPPIIFNDLNIVEIRPIRGSIASKPNVHLRDESSSTLMPLFPAMTYKTSPELSGAVWARLAYLRRRKALLDDLIQSLERYSVHELRAPEAHEKTKEIAPRMAGAA
jgi:hypothetical protein